MVMKLYILRILIETGRYLKMKKEVKNYMKQNKGEVRRK
jgi:hypothetical protein